MADAHLQQRGEKTKKQVEEKEHGVGKKKRRNRFAWLASIFRIDFPRWFPWFCATARKKERVATSFPFSLFFFNFLPRGRHPAVSAFKFFSPFSYRLGTLYFPFHTRASFSCHCLLFLFLVLRFD